MLDIVISEFMDEPAVDGFAPDFHVDTAPRSSTPEEPLAGGAPRRAWIVRNRTQVRAPCSRPRGARGRGPARRRPRQHRPRGLPYPRHRGPARRGCERHRRRRARDRRHDSCCCAAPSRRPAPCSRAAGRAGLWSARRRPAGSWASSATAASRAKSPPRAPSACASPPTTPTSPWTTQPGGRSSATSLSSLPPPTQSACTSR